MATSRDICVDNNAWRIDIPTEVSGSFARLWALTQVQSRVAMRLAEASAR